MLQPHGSVSFRFAFVFIAFIVVAIFFVWQFNTNGATQQLKAEKIEQTSQENSEVEKKLNVKILIPATTISTDPILILNAPTSNSATKPTVDNFLKAQFERIYSTNMWGGNGRGSGVGSSLERTVTLREELPKLLRKYNIASMIDAPCGGMNWMPLVLDTIEQSYAPNFRYLGIDVAETYKRFKDRIRKAYKLAISLGGHHHHHP